MRYREDTGPAPVAEFYEDFNEKPINFELPAGWARSGPISIWILIRNLPILGSRPAGPGPSRFLLGFYLKFYQFRVPGWLGQVRADFY